MSNKNNHEPNAPDGNVRLMACDFEIRGDIPKRAFELFIVAQAAILGLRGYIMQMADDLYHGTLEGEAYMIEAFREVIEAGNEFVQHIVEAFFKECRAIEEYSHKEFEIKERSDAT